MGVVLGGVPLPLPRRRYIHRASRTVAPPPTPEEEVTSVIDFEFVGEDWRIMELATCISKFPEEVQPLSNLSLFIGGFRQANLVILQRQEVESLPWMIKTRILSNVIYFVGRAMSGEAELSQLTERIQGYCRRLRWLDDERNKADLISLFD